MKIAVIGGGPAGATLAFFLNRGGMDVALFDDRRRPDLIVGESLIPAVVPILQAMGLEEKVAAFSVQKPGVTFQSADGESFPFSFGPIARYVLPYAYNVPRPQFDDLLFDTAIESGVAHVAERATLRVEDGDRVELAPETLARLPHWNGRQPDLVVDASGRRRLIGHLLKIPVTQGPRRDVSYFAHFEGHTPPEPAGQVLIKHLQAGWSWSIPLQDRVSVGIVVPKAEAGRLGATPEERLSAAIAEDPVHSVAANNARRVTPVMTYANYQQISDRGYGANWVAIGDAYGFVDPMLSPGMWLAMHSAEMLSGLLARKPLPAALKQYGKRMDAALKAWMELITYFYDGRIFAMHEIGRQMRARHDNPLARRFHNHLGRQFAAMASGALTQNPYSRTLLRHFGRVSQVHGHPEKFCIV